MKAYFGKATFVSRAGEERDAVHSSGQGEGEVAGGDHAGEGEPGEHGDVEALITHPIVLFVVCEEVGLRCGDRWPQIRENKPK